MSDARKQWMEERARRNAKAAAEFHNGRSKRVKKQHGQRFAMLNDFIDMHAQTVGVTAAAVWLVLFRDARGNRVRVSQAYVARRLAIHPSTVKRAIGKLIRRKLVRREYQGGLKGRGSSVYTIHIPQSIETTVPPNRDH